MSDPLVFIHIPKASGTSVIRGLIEPQFGVQDEYTYSLARVGPMLNAHGRAEGHFGSWEGDPEFIRNRIADCPLQIECLYGHMPYAEYLPGHCDYATFLRHPVARAASVYYYLRLGTGWEEVPQFAGAVTAAQSLSLSEFVEANVTGGVRNGMTAFIAGQSFMDEVTTATLELARKNLGTFAFVGVTERFNESVKGMAERFGWYAPVVPHLNATAHPVVTKAVADDIASMNWLDIELWLYANELLGERDAA
jgi:hypothetical protein